MSGKVLRNLRISAGLSGYVVSRQSAIGRSRLSEIERGHSDPKPGEVERIQRAIESLIEARDAVTARAAEVGWPM